MRETRLAIVAALRTQSNVAKGEHVAIWPMPRACMCAPTGQVIESGSDVFPAIPQVVANPPKLRVSREKISMIERRRTGREAQHNLTSRVRDGAVQCCYLFLVQGASLVIGFYIVDAPGGIEIHDRIHIGLGARF